YWQAKTSKVDFELSFEEAVKFNTIRIVYSGTLTTWAIRQRGDEPGTFTEIPGTVKTYQQTIDTPIEIIFRINDVTTDQLQFYTFGSSKNDFCIYEFQLEYNKDQIATSTFNSNISDEKREVYPLINGGERVLDPIMKSDGGYIAQNTDSWSTSIEQERSKLEFDNRKWAKGLDEVTVFDTQITHTDSDPELNWTMRVGLGGQIYSLQTAIGEIIPLQCSNAEWMDEVWQLVAVSHDRMFDRSFSPTTHFIHQAGMYKGFDHEETNTHFMDDTFFSPRLAEEWDEDERSFTTLNLGTTPTVNISRSDTLFYTKTRDCGEGIIEFTYGIANYSDNKIDFMNLPWGGVSHNALPDVIFSNPDGTYFEWGNDFDSLNELYNYTGTNGWMAYTQDMKNNDSFTVAFVPGKHDELDETFLEDNKGDANLQVFYSADGADNRDYNVLSTIITDKVKGDELYFCRIYVVIGKLSDVVKKANDMAQYVYYGYQRPDTADKVSIGKATDSSGKTYLTPVDNGGDFSLYASHVAGSRPLYLLYDVEAGRYFVSVDPYIITKKLSLADYQDVEKQPWSDLYHSGEVIHCLDDGSTQFIGILGYTVPVGSDGAGLAALSDILPSDLFYGTGVGDEGLLVFGK
ncbi:MAG: hypothetical protein IKU19_05125, partial [Clostridia bacterium]|nr:hypothetical protein [Clostridia bacterium]